MIMIYSFLLLFPLYNIYFWTPISNWGSDQRFEKESEIDLNIEFEILKKIQANMVKQFLLEKLLLNTTNEIIKMKIIETEMNAYNEIISNNSKYICNINKELYDKYFF